MWRLLLNIFKKYHISGQSIKMKYPLRNLIYERVRQFGQINDTDLLSSLLKDGISLSMIDLNKILLDLEIYGLLRVSWITKDKRRIETVESNQ